MPVIDFWYEFASTYSYPAAMRIEALAADREVTVRWRPFLLGPILKEQGFETSPFNVHEQKGRYMWQDVARICAEHGLAFTRPDPFPQESLLAARVALTEAVSPQRARFSREVYDAEFAEGRQIGDAEAIAGILSEMGFEPESVLAEARSDAVKQRLKDETAEARRLGIFGAPSFVTESGELFWGQDRMQEALEAAAGKRWR